MDIKTLGQLIVITLVIVEVMKRKNLHRDAIAVISVLTGVLAVYVLTPAVDGQGIAVGALVGMAASGGYEVLNSVWSVVKGTTAALGGAFKKKQQ